MLSSLVGAKLAIAAVAGSLSIGGVAAAAVTGSLPFEHPSGAVSASDDQGASESPAPSASADPSESADPTATASPTASAAPSGSIAPTGVPEGPDATGPAAFGLCHAFGGDKALRKAGNPSVANRNLIAAATAAGQSVQDYCAVILGTPTTSPTPTSTDPATATTGDHGHGHSKAGTHGHGSNHGHGHGHP